jgi:hypothetical protein
MGRDYFGLINGSIPSSITDELPFVDMCCKFKGYIQRYEGCGCYVVESDNGWQQSVLPGGEHACATTAQGAIYTECLYHGSHRSITEDTSFAKWYIRRSSIPLLKEKIKYIKDILNHPTAIDNLIHKRFMIDIMEQLIEAFSRYEYEDTITFTSEVS